MSVVVSAPTHHLGHPVAVSVSKGTGRPTHLGGIAHLSLQRAGDSASGEVLVTVASAPARHPQVVEHTDPVGVSIWVNTDLGRVAYRELRLIDLPAAITAPAFHAAVIQEGTDVVLACTHQGGAD